MILPFLKPGSSMRRLSAVERDARRRIAGVPYTDRGWAYRLARFA